VVWSWVVIAGNGVAGAWCLTGHWVVALRKRGAWWLTAVAQVSTFVQVGIGVGLVAGQEMDVDRFHMFYGFLCLIAIAILYSYRQQLRGREHLLYGVGGLFVMGLAIRAFYLT
jgi:hypothetical protein